MTSLAPYYTNEETGISYTLSPEGYYIPDLALPPQPEGNLNRWGRARLSYLREHKPLLHTHMLTQCTLWPHLLEIQETADERMELLTAQMAVAEGMTENLKSRNQMLWIGRMNNIRARAEEIIREDLIYS